MATIACLLTVETVKKTVLSESAKESGALSGMLYTTLHPNPHCLGRTSRSERYVLFLRENCLLRTVYKNAKFLSKRKNAREISAADGLCIFRHGHTRARFEQF